MKSMKNTVKVNGISVEVKKVFGQNGDRVWFYYSEKLGRWIETSSRTKIDLVCNLEWSEEFDA